jgi:hypothetical protein
MNDLNFWLAVIVYFVLGALYYFIVSKLWKSHELSHEENEYINNYQLKRENYRTLLGTFINGLIICYFINEIYKYLGYNKDSLSIIVIGFAAFYLIPIISRYLPLKQKVKIFALDLIFHTLAITVTTIVLFYLR